jgi:hypothetical protein
LKILATAVHHLTQNAASHPNLQLLVDFEKTAQTVAALSQVDDEVTQSLVCLRKIYQVPIGFNALVDSSEAVE